MDKTLQGPINMRERRTRNEGFFAVPAPGPVKMDGYLDDWDLSGQIETFSEFSLKDMFSVKTAAMWDEDYLYLAFDWRDPYPLKNGYNPLQDRNHGWNADSVQLRLLVDNRPMWLTTWPYGGDKAVGDMVYLHKRGPDGRSKGTEFDKLYYNGEPGNWELNDGVGLAYREAEDGKGFIQEMRIPWKELYLADHKAKADECIRLGLDFQFGKPGGMGFRLHNCVDNLQPKHTGGQFWGAYDDWGDLKLIDHPVAEKRIYRMAEEEKEGLIPLRVQVPANAKTFTVTLNTPDGERIRNVAGGYSVKDYTVEEKDGMATVEVLWNGLDEAGNLAPAGDYVLKGITADSIDGYYEGCFYNPGKPAWETSDGGGMWTADHTLAQQLAPVGDYIVIASRFGECAYSTFALNLEGEDIYVKRWNEMRGTDALASDDKYIYLIPNDWHDTGRMFLRMEGASGKYAPYVVEGKEQPMPFYLDAMLEDPKEVSITAMAVEGNSLYMRCTDHSIREIDLTVGKQCATHTLTVDEEGEGILKGSAFGFYNEKKPSAIAVKNRKLYYTMEGKILVLDLENGETMPSPFTTVEKAVDVVFDKAGFFYVADDGASQQIVKYTADGQEVLRIGKAGGRPGLGKYDRNGLLHPTSIAVDVNGRIWATEAGRCPRRISLWNADGSFCKEFIGSAGYQGEGTFIHNDDPDKAFGEFAELKRNHETGEWEVENLMYNPDYNDGWRVRPPRTHFDRGSIFFSEASGKKEEYYAGMGFASDTNFFMMVKRDDKWMPVAAIASVASVTGCAGGKHEANLVRLPYGDWADCDPGDLIFWNDYNNDGKVTRDECVIVPAIRPALKEGDTLPKSMNVVGNVVHYAAAHGSTISADDLAFFLLDRANKNDTCLIKPAYYREGGLPVYLPDNITPMGSDFTIEIGGAFASSQFVTGKDLVVGFIRQNGKIYVAGYRRSDCKLLWKYICPYHGVQGSHGAPMARPGLIIGGLKILGCAQDCGDSDVIVIRGNQGEDFYLTTDGMYISNFYRDTRLPAVQLPEDEETLRKVSVAQYPGHCEHFSGRFTRHSDGVIRCHGAVPASTAGNIIRIEGLESIKHYAPVPVTVTAQQLVEAEADNQARALRLQKAKDAMKARPLSVEPNDETYPNAEIGKPGQGARAWFRASYDAEKLCLNYTVQGMRWVNGSKVPQLLFKGGDCLDFQCSPTANKQYLPARGDFRLLVAPFNGKNVAVLMRPNDGKTVWDADTYKYTSPVTDLVFQTVKVVEEAAITIRQEEERIHAEIQVPWAALGMTAPKAGDVLTGDVGFILADASGKANAARVYRNNPSTNLVSDQPNEARITPNAFGEIRF